MTDKKYQIVVTGLTVPGVDRAQVKEAVAALFKTPVAKLASLFSGQRVVIKKGLDEAAAQRYVDSLFAAGLLSSAEALNEAPPAVDTAPARPASTHGEPDLAPVGVTLIEAKLTPAPAIDTSAYTMAPAGSDIVKQEKIAPPEIDISALSAAEPGADMTDAAPVPPRDIDTSSLSMSSPGALLVEAQPVPPARIDTSALDLAPTGSDVGQQKPADPPPPPNTSHLKLS